MSDPVEPAGEVTALLKSWSEGDSAALEQLLPTIYRELRLIAGTYFARERANHTLQPTALVSEACLKLIGTEVRVENRRHFFAVCARVMRQVLIDHARVRYADKRIPPENLLPLAEEPMVTVENGECFSILDLERALARLEELDERQARIVELRFFGGMTLAETASTMEISEATVSREWAMARLFLHRQLQTGSSRRPTT